MNDDAKTDDHAPAAEQRSEQGRAWEDALFGSVGEVARATDRWFVAVAEDVVDAGRWARREADVLGESMRAALRTTKDVAAQLKDSATGRSKEPSARGSAATSPPGVDALNGVGVPRATDESPLRRAGITPLLTALAQVVSSRAPNGYEALEMDEHFWVLVELIYRHRDRAMGGDEEK